MVSDISLSQGYLIDMKRAFSELKREFSEEASSLDFQEKDIRNFLKDVYRLLVFDYEHPSFTNEEYEAHAEKVETEFVTLLHELHADLVEEKTKWFLRSLPEIRRTLNTTISAIYNGDPAAKSKQQIVLEYPGFKAILYYRVAHLLYLMDLYVAARYISEYAHSRTGIDINPGATIGDYFFIDHGTGIVIGETALIGDYVKLYQGVTLGALSLSKGRSLIGKKRHPTVEDHVTIYSNAAIFGGDTVIGSHSTIGAVVYLTHSVPPYSVVRHGEKGLEIISQKKNGNSKASH